MSKIYNFFRMHIKVFIFLALCSLFSVMSLSNSYLWVGGDSISTQRLWEFIFSYKNMWGLKGSDTSFSFTSWYPIVLIISFFKIFLGKFLDVFIFTAWIFISSLGYYKLYSLITKNKLMSGLLAATALASPYMWLVVNRNVFFLLVLFASIPWIIISLKNVLEYEKSEDKKINTKPWLYFSFIMLFSSAGLMNPGYAVPAFIFIISFIFVFIDWRTNIKRWLGVIVITTLFALPNIIGQVNLLLHSQALKDDYWNNIVLTKIPLDRQIKTNTIDQVVKGYNGDTLTDYGFLNGEKYYPWWFAKHKDSFTSLFLYIPLLLALGALFFLNKKSRFIILYWISFLLFYIFMIKSSSGPGGEYFYNFMMDHGWFKMFRSPHQKFGVEYILVLCILIGIAFNFIKNKSVKNVFIGGIGLYISIFGVYPLLTGKYIPELQKVKNIPTVYYELQKFLQNENTQNKKYDLGILMPANESTWDSNNWGSDGFYEGYHILHWMNTGTSFLNRNGLSFNAKNAIGFDAWIKMKDYNVDSIKILKDQGYDIIVYDKSSDRKSRFGIGEKHNENIMWLDGLTRVSEVEKKEQVVNLKNKIEEKNIIQKIDPVLEKIWEKDFLVVYRIK